MNDITVEDLKSRLSNGETLNLLDVRETWEYDEFNIGAKNLPLSSFMSFIPDLEELKDEEVIVHCKMGGRSMQAAAILEQMGFKNVKNVVGGIEEWMAKFSR